MFVYALCVVCVCLCMLVYLCVFACARACMSLCAPRKLGIECEKEVLSSESKVSLSARPVESEERSNVPAVALSIGLGGLQAL